MVLGKDDITAICEALLPMIREEMFKSISEPALPTRSEQIKAFARDPQLAKQMFKRKRTVKDA